MLRRLDVLTTRWFLNGVALKFLVSRSVQRESSSGPDLLGSSMVLHRFPRTPGNNAHFDYDSELNVHLPSITSRLPRLSQPSHLHPEYTRS